MAIRNNFDGLSPTEKLILFALFMGRNGGVGGFFTTSDIARLTGTINEGRIRVILHDLSDRLYVEKKLSGKRSLRWRISNDVFYVMNTVLNDVLGCVSGVPF